VLNSGMLARLHVTLSVGCEQGSGKVCRLRMIVNRSAAKHQKEKLNKSAELWASTSPVSSRYA